MARGIRREYTVEEFRLSYCRPGAAVLDEEEDAPATAPRVQRLEVLIRLRKLYRNLLRADGLLAQPSPVYQPFERPGVLHLLTLWQ